MTEQQIADGLMRAYPHLDKLRKAEDQFSPFDYENDRYLFEFKSRKDNWNPWIIEQLKVDTNTNISESLKKDFIFVIENLGTGYVWNISKLIKNGYDFKFEEKRVPSATELTDHPERNGKMIHKPVGYLFVEKGTVVNLG